MKYNIPIIVVAYNRPGSLMRLLDSLSSAVYQHKTKLIISIDKSDDKSIGEIAEGFEWKHGEKEIIRHKKHLGLRDHILSAGDLSLEADGVIILEDDLYVSPFFYDYSVKAFEYYQNEKNIAGVSLYAHNYNETARLPFTPLLDDSDVFFLQIPSSWGQCWSKNQWSEFKSWLEKNKDKEPDSNTGLPTNALSWPDSSWKKYFFWYMINTNKYFAYPRFSLTSNFGDPGTHYKGKELFLQTPLVNSKRKFVFKKPKDSFATYDAFCELLPDKLVNLQPALNKFDFTTDLYGTKTLDQISTPYVLTSKSCNSAIFSFARELKPHEANVINKVEGKDLFLAKKNECIEAKPVENISDTQFYYFFNIRDFQIEPYSKLSKKVKNLTDNQSILSDSLKQKDILLSVKDKSLADKEEIIKKHAQYESIAENRNIEKDNQINEYKLYKRKQEKLLDDSLSEKKILAAKLEKQENLLNNCYNDLEKLKHDFNSKLLQIENQNAKIEHLTNENANKDKQLEVNTNEVNILNKEVLSLKLSLKDSESKAKQLNSEVTSLKHSIEEKESQVKQKDSDIASLKLDLKDKESQVEKLANNNSSLNLSLKDKEFEVEKLETKVTGLQIELETNIDVSEKLQKQLSELQVSLNKTEELKNQLQEKNALLNSKLISAREKEMRLIETNRNLDTQIEELRDFIKGVEKSYTFRIGKAIIWPASKIKHALKSK